MSQGSNRAPPSRSAQGQGQTKSHTSQGGQGQGGGRQDGGFKSRMCKFWEAGTCRQGSGCNFAHGTDEVAGKPRRREGGQGGGGGDRRDGGKRDGGRDGGNRGGDRGRSGHHGNSNAGQNRDAFVLPERPPLVVPNLNEGKSAEEIETAAKRESERLAKQKEFVAKFLEEIKYDESVMHED